MCTTFIRIHFGIYIMDIEEIPYNKYTTLKESIFDHIV